MRTPLRAKVAPPTEDDESEEEHAPEPWRLNIARLRMRMAEHIA